MEIMQQINVSRLRRRWLILLEKMTMILRWTGWSTETCKYVYLIYWKWCCCSLDESTIIFVLDSPRPGCLHDSRWDACGTSWVGQGSVLGRGDPPENTTKTNKTKKKLANHNCRVSQTSYLTPWQPKNSELIRGLDRLQMFSSPRNRCRGGDMLWEP